MDGPAATSAVRPSRPSPRRHGDPRSAARTAAMPARPSRPSAVSFPGGTGAIRRHDRVEGHRGSLQVRPHSPCPRDLLSRPASGKPA